VESWLAVRPNSTARELLTRLANQLPELYPTGAQLRILQRRVKDWRAQRARELVFAASSAVRADRGIQDQSSGLRPSRITAAN
jgi:hypothetical protein